jgi:uncharacterized damage-inducible protein DinB
MLGSLAVTQFRYNQWATNQVLEETLTLPSDQLLKTLNGSFPSIYATVVHLYQADCIWLDRLQGLPTAALSDYEVPGCNFEFRDAWSAILDKMVAKAESLSENDWLQEVSYKTLAGVPCKNPLWQLALHIVNHGTHHRGQITGMLRQLGVKPANLDLLGYYRNNPLPQAVTA